MKSIFGILFFAAFTLPMAKANSAIIPSFLVLENSFQKITDENNDPLENARRTSNLAREKVIQANIALQQATVEYARAQQMLLIAQQSDDGSFEAKKEIEAAERAVKSASLELEKARHELSRARKLEKIAQEKYSRLFSLLGGQ